MKILLGREENIEIVTGKSWREVLWLCKGGLQVCFHVRHRTTWAGAAHGQLEELPVSNSEASETQTIPEVPWSHIPLFSLDGKDHRGNGVLKRFSSLPKREQPRHRAHPPQLPFLPKMYLPALSSSFHPLTSSVTGTPVDSTPLRDLYPKLQESYQIPVRNETAPSGASWRLGIDSLPAFEHWTSLAIAASLLLSESVIRL